MHQESAESTWLYDLMAWYEVHKKQVHLGAVGLLVVIAGLYVYSWQREQSELAAARDLLALRALGAADGPPAASATEFLKVARTHPSTSAGERALLLAAGNLFGEGKYAEAQAQFEKFASDYGGSLLAPIAAYGVAASLDAQDKLEAAITAYQQVITRFPNDSTASRSKLALATCYLSKHQPEQAMRIYEELTRPAAMSGVMEEAAARKEHLLQRFPQLAGTNTPPAPPQGTALKAAAPSSVAKPAAQPAAPKK